MQISSFSMQNIARRIISFDLILAYLRAPEQAGPVAHLALVLRRPTARFPVAYS